MNRRKFLLTAGSLSTVAIAGCTSEGDSSDNGAQKATSTDGKNTDKQSKKTTETTTTTTTTSQDTQLKLAFGETAKLENGVHVTVHGLEFKDSYETDGWEQKPKDGMVFLFVKATAENKGEKAQYLPSPMDITAIVGGDQLSDYMYSGKDAYTLDSGKSQPGISEEGYIVYEVPSGTSEGDVEIQWYQETVNDDFEDVTIDVRWSSK